MDVDKSEIMELKEGMSSEELDALTTGEEPEKVKDDKLAQEALDATQEESPPADESVKDEPKDETAETKPDTYESADEAPADLAKVDPKDAVIGDFRRKNRDLELEKARLEGELEGQKSTTKSAEVPKSPLEIAEAAHIAEYGDLERFTMNGELYRKQRAFDDENAAKKTAIATQEQSKVQADRAVQVLQTGDLSAEKVGQGLDFRTIVGLGQRYLDKADVLKVEVISQRDGMEAGVRKAYELCKAGILAAGNSDSQLLQHAIDAHKKSQVKPPKKLDVDALITEDEDDNKGETEADTPNERLVNFMFS